RKNRNPLAFSKQLWIAAQTPSLLPGKGRLRTRPSSRKRRNAAYSIHGFSWRSERRQASRIGSPLWPPHPDASSRNSASILGANPHPAATALTSLAATRGLSSSRSEEHTSELQSRVDLVCRLLLEKKKNKANKLSEIKAPLNCDVSNVSTQGARR